MTSRSTTTFVTTKCIITLLPCMVIVEGVLSDEVGRPMFVLIEVLCFISTVTPLALLDHIRYSHRISAMVITNGVLRGIMLSTI